MKFFIKGSRLIAKGTQEVLISPPEGTVFDFIPGQYIELELIEPKYRDDRGNSRTFSIASASHEKDLAVAFRMSDSAFKKSLMETQRGKEVLAQGPFGLFTVSKNQREPLLFIAGGIGITPFISILRSSAVGGDYPPITLLYANREQELAAYHSELVSLSEKHFWFSYIPHIGMLDEGAIKKAGANDASLIYLAGPSGMVAGAIGLLQNTGISRGKILAEEFTGY